MNSAARVVTETRKYDSGLSRLMHDELHWLDVTVVKMLCCMFLCVLSVYGPSAWNKTDDDDDDTIQARSAHVSMSPWNCSAVLDLVSEWVS